MSDEKEWVSFSVTLRKYNRVTIPPTVIRELKLKNGDRLAFEGRKMKPLEGDYMVMIPLDKK